MANSWCHGDHLGQIPPYFLDLHNKTSMILTHGLYCFNWSIFIVNVKTIRLSAQLKVQFLDNCVVGSDCRRLFKNCLSNLNVAFLSGEGCLRTLEWQGMLKSVPCNNIILQYCNQIIIIWSNKFRFILGYPNKSI